MLVTLDYYFGGVGWRVDVESVEVQQAWRRMGIATGCLLLMRLAASHAKVGLCIRGVSHPDLHGALSRRREAFIPVDGDFVAIIP